MYVCTQTGTAAFCTLLAIGMELPLGDHGSPRPLPIAPCPWFPGCRRPLVEWQPATVVTPTTAVVITVATPPATVVTPTTAVTPPPLSDKYDVETQTPPPLSELVEVTHELRASHAPAAHIALAKALPSLPAAQPRASKRTAQQEKELQAIKDKETMEKWQKIKDKQLPNNQARLGHWEAMMLNGLALDLGNGATSTWRPGQTTWTLRQPL